MWDIDALKLNCFGRRAEPWRRFAGRYGPSVRSLKIDATCVAVTEAIA